MTLTWEPASHPVDLGRHLVGLRGQRGWTQAEVVDALGISRRYVWEMEECKPSLCPVHLFRMLSLLDAGLVLEGEDVA